MAESANTATSDPYRIVGVTVMPETSEISYKLTQELFKLIKDQKCPDHFSITDDTPGLQRGVFRVNRTREPTSGILASKRSEPFETGALRVMKQKAKSDEGRYYYRVKVEIVKKDIGLSLKDTFIN